MSDEFKADKYEENLKIAKLAFREIKSLINKFEHNPENEINCCWDECLWVNDDFFTHMKLEDEND